MSDYNIDLSVMGFASFTITTACSEEHAKELAIQYLQQDYPDLTAVVVNAEEVKAESEDG